MKRNTTSSLLRFIDSLRLVDKEALDELRNIVLQKNAEVHGKPTGSVSRHKRGYLSLADKNKIDIIGGLPFLLNSPEYFPSSESIRRFAQDKLNITVSRGNKTRPELIGIVIVGVAELPTFETQRISNALNAVMRNVKDRPGRNIFLEWEKAINSI